MRAISGPLTLAGPTLSSPPPVSCGLSHVTSLCRLSLHLVVKIGFTVNAPRGASLPNPLLVPSDHLGTEAMVLLSDKAK